MERSRNPKNPSGAVKHPVYPFLASLELGTGWRHHLRISKLALGQANKIFYRPDAPLAGMETPSGSEDGGDF